MFFLKSLRWPLFGLLIFGFFACKDPLETFMRNPDRSLKYDKAFEFYEKKDWERAQPLLEQLIPLYRGQVEAERIYFAYAYTHFHTRNYTFSSYYFKQFYVTYPNSEKAEEALYMAAMSAFNLSPRYRLTQEETQKAIEQFQLFVNTFPLSQHVTDCNAKIDALRAKLEYKDLQNAKGYYHRKQYRSALHSFSSLLETYPETQKAAYAKFMILSSAYRYAQESIIEKQLERFEEAEGYYQRFSPKLSSSEYAQAADDIHQNIIQKIKKLQDERN